MGEEGRRKDWRKEDKEGREERWVGREMGMKEGRKVKMKKG